MTPNENQAIIAEETAHVIRPVSRGEYNLLRSIAKKLRADRTDFTDTERFIADTYRISI